MEFIYEIAEIPNRAKALLENVNSNILIFNGKMGVGKTTFIKALIQELGVEDYITSPTFSLVNEYEKNGKLIFHFDLYRINSVEEVMDIGFEEYLENGSYIFIEWPEKILHLLPTKYTEINIKTTKDKKRNLISKENNFKV